MSLSPPLCSPLILQIRCGYLFVKDTRRNKYVIARVNTTKCHLPLLHQLRRATYRDADVASIQLCRQLKFDMPITPSRRPLYQQICQLENLQLAWLKVKGGNKKSRGIDGVSMGELSALRAELA